MMRISIGNDHAGTECKKFILENLEKDGHELVNHGTDDPDSVDYPDFVHPVAKDVVSQKSDRGIVICGSGNGVAMTVNKYSDIRAALCWEVELAKLARLHNDANVLAIPARFVSRQLALDMVKVFLKTEFEGGRHCRRVDKISQKL
jgi:ribose 5-phosphate isomerase B